MKKLSNLILNDAQELSKNEMKLVVGGSGSSGYQPCGSGSLTEFTCQGQFSYGGGDLTDPVLFPTFDLSISGGMYVERSSVNICANSHADALSQISSMNITSGAYSNHYGEAGSPSFSCSI